VPDLFTIIAPVFLIMIMGYGLGKTRLFPEGSASVLTTFVWYVAVPAMLIGALAPKDLPHADELWLILGYYSAVFLVYAVAYFIAKKAVKLEATEASVFALTVCFANGVFLGVPVLEAVYGDEGVRLLLMLLSFHSLTLLPVTTVIMERGLNKTSGSSASKRIVDNIRQNPVLIALLVGLSWSALSLPFPNWLDRVLQLPAQAASPVGLFVVGLALSHVRIAGNLKHALVMIVFKLMLLPLMVFSVTHFLLNLPVLWVGVATILGALPSGMMSYSFAAEYSIGERRAATAVLLSTVLSAFTLSIVLLLLRWGGFI